VVQYAGFDEKGGIPLKGTLIVLEGLDGSGKATQAQALRERLEGLGLPVRKLSFPVYESPSSALVRMYLQGEFGTDPQAVNAYAASSFYAVDRYASYKKDWADFYAQGGILVADRYTTSNAIHQCSKLEREEWEAFLQWLFHYEYQLLGIPAPDLVLYLEVDPQVSQELIRGRYQGDESKKDIHERDLDYLERSRAAAEHCAQVLGWQRIRCTQGGTMRSRESIAEEISSSVEQLIHSNS
jgi:dTMP kinase